MLSENDIHPSSAKKLGLTHREIAECASYGHNTVTRTFARVQEQGGELVAGSVHVPTGSHTASV